MAVGECRVAGAGGAQSAKTAAGDDVKASVWLQSHKKGEQLPQHPSAAVMATVADELQHGISLTLTLQRLAASSGGTLIMRVASCRVVGPGVLFRGSCKICAISQVYLWKAALASRAALCLCRGPLPGAGPEGRRHIPGGHRPGRD